MCVNYLENMQNKCVKYSGNCQWYTKKLVVSNRVRGEYAIDFLRRFCCC